MPNSRRERDLLIRAEVSPTVRPRRKATIRTDATIPRTAFETSHALCGLAGPLRTGSGTRILYRQPNALAGRRHVEAFDPERCERIDDGVDYRRQRADCAGLARALGAQWIALGRHRVRSDLHVRHRIGAWHAVIHEAAGQVLPRFAVVDDQGLAQPLRDAAMDLAFEAD